MFSVFLLEVGDQAGQHLRDFLEPVVEDPALGLGDVLALNGDHELRSRFPAGSASTIAILCEMTVCRLLEPFGDERNDTGGRGRELLTQTEVGVE